MSEFRPPPFLQGIGKSPIRRFSDREKPGDISFGLGEPDLPTPEVIRREAVRVIQEERNGYTFQAGLPALRERVAREVRDATIVFVVCDRGDRYLSTGVFPA